MDDDIAIKVEHVSKKYSKSLKSSMFYGINDILRNSIGLSSNSESLRNEEFWAVDDVSFELKKGEILGIIGSNGSGKTTLLKMLNGIFWPDKGKITIRGKVGALIEVGAGFHPLLTGRENIYLNAAILGMNKEEIDKKFDDIVAFADIGDFLDSPVKKYSSGMYVRLGFSVAVHSEPEILLVDEVLAVGDLGFQVKCLNKIGELRKKGTSIIIVTHNMHTLSAFADMAILLNKSKMKYYGEVSKAIEQYRAIFNDGKSGNFEIEKVVTSTDEFSVTNVQFSPSKELKPLDNLKVQIDYESKNDLNNVEIDIVIYGKNKELYFQGTNHSFNFPINIKKGKGKINIILHKIPINSSNATLAVTIWKENRSEILFWWRNIVFSFSQASTCSGENFLEVSYEIQ